MPRYISGRRSLICSSRKMSKPQSRQPCSRLLMIEPPFGFGSRIDDWRFGVDRTTESLELRREDIVLDGPCCGSALRSETGVERTQG